MLLLRAKHLLAKVLIDRRGRIGRWCRRIAIIDRIDGKEQILLAEVVVHARRAKVLANMLRWIGEGFGDATTKIVSSLWPKRQQRLNAGNGGSSCRGIRNKCQVAQPKMLAVSLVVRE